MNRSKHDDGASEAFITLHHFRTGRTSKGAADAVPDNFDHASVAREGAEACLAEACTSLRSWSLDKASLQQRNASLAVPYLHLFVP